MGPARTSPPSQQHQQPRFQQYQQQQGRQNVEHRQQMYSITPRHAKVGRGGGSYGSGSGHDGGGGGGNGGGYGGGYGRDGHSSERGGNCSGGGYSGGGRTPNRKRGRSQSRERRDRIDGVDWYPRVPHHFTHRGLAGRGNSTYLQHHQGRPQQHHQDGAVGRVGRLLRAVKDDKTSRGEKVTHAMQLIELGALYKPRLATVIISSLGRCGAVDDALATFAKVPLPNMITYSAAISACEKGTQWERALELFDELKGRGIKPDLLIYIATISACGAGAQCEPALALFEEMKRRGIEPTVPAYGAILSACAKAAAWETARALFGEMARRGLAPDVVAYEAVIAACHNAGAEAEARRAYCEVVEMA